MAGKRTNSKKRGRLSYTRKMEIAGILIMSLAVLLMLSIVSYKTADYAIVRSMPTGSLFSMDQGQALRVGNWLGVVGAYISYFFVHVAFGYFSLALPMLLFSFGWFVFRGKPLADLSRTVALGIWAMILLSTFMGWFYIEFEGLSSSWSGSSGVAFARILQNITGIGSVVILTVLTLVTLLVVIDRDLQKTVDAFNNGLDNLRDKRTDGVSASPGGGKKRHEEKGKNRWKLWSLFSSGGNRSESEKRVEESTGVRQETDRRPGASIDEIVERSHKEDMERLSGRKEEMEGLGNLPRASLEKPSSVPVSGGSDGLGDTGGEEVEEFSVYKGEGDEEAGYRELDRINRDKADEIPVIKYKFPTIDLLDSPPNEGNEVDLEEVRENKRIILEKLKRHKIEILSINAIVGPTVTLYELEPAPDVKISKIESYSNDLKMATAAHGLRIIAPIPGRSAVGIEVPNRSRETVYIKSLINTKKFVETDYDLPVAFGKTIENEVFMIDLTRMPHLLMAGATGSGKTVGINTIITCLLYKCHPDDLKFVMIDPKKIELSLFREIQNHYLAVVPGSEEPIVTDTDKALEVLQSVCMEMDERYELLKMAMVRDIKSYNEKHDRGDLEAELGHRHLPYIVVIIDELADLMMTAGKQIEEPIARLAQLARAIGIHLVVATQRPSVNVITGTIKANFPARLAYQVASKVDSRTILDVGGADQLVGRGDMLFTNGGGMTRIQNAFVSTEEVEKITSYIGRQKGYKQPFRLPQVFDNSQEGVPDPLDDIDEFFIEAAKLVILHQQGSVSLLQRKLKIGYNRAGRIIDQLFYVGFVGPYQGSTARDVLVEDNEELTEILDELGIH